MREITEKGGKRLCRHYIFVHESTVEMLQHGLDSLQIYFYTK
jgi:hypothetical protein